MALGRFAVLGLVFVVGCSRSGDIPSHSLVRHASLAPAALSRAAEATVLVTTYDDNTGTAFFVNDTGLLVTNNHVLGAENPSRIRCAAEGCYAELTFNLQQGMKSHGKEYFIEPIRASLSLDIAVFQVRESKAGAKLATPAFINLAEAVEPALNQQVHIVGHSLSGLKRWTAGSIFSLRKPFFSATNFSLHGNSGSPALNDAGQLVGIIHTVPEGHGHLTAQDIRVFSYGTVVSWLKNMIAGLDVAKLVTPFPSVETERTVAEAADFGDLYLLAQEKTVHLPAGKTTTMLEVLAEVCDARLAAPPSNPDMHGKFYSPCYQALEWVNCRDRKDGEEYKSCPEGAAKERWQSRFDALADRAWASHRANPFQPAIAASFFESDKSKRQQMQKERTEAFLKKYDVALSPAVGFYVLDAADDVNTAEYRGVSLKKYFLNFRTIHAYHQQYEHIIDAVFVLRQQDAIDDAQLLQLTRSILADKLLPMDDRFSLEKRLYFKGF